MAPKRNESGRCGIALIDLETTMTMQDERTRSILQALEFLRELRDSEKHPETTPESRLQISGILRHFPDASTLGLIAFDCPSMIARPESESYGGGKK